MTTHVPQARALNMVTDPIGADKTERDALALKITELTGIAEYLAQTIAISQGQVERLEKEVEDFQRHRQQAELQLQAQETENATKRQEIHVLEMTVKKNEATIITQQERIRNLAETIEIAERRSKQAIETFQAEANGKFKAIQHEFETEKERLILELDTYHSQTQMDMKLLSEELEQNRKKQHRALEIELQDMRRKAEETVAKTLQDGRSKNEALIKATEATVLEVHRESETAAKSLLVEANQKAADLIRAAQHEAEEVRRRTHNAEVNFLKEKNSDLAEMKLIVANAKEEAQVIISAAMKEATELQYKVEKDNEAKISAANSKTMQTRKASEKETQDFIEKAKSELGRQAKEQEAMLAQKLKETENYVVTERKRLEDEARTIVSSARERAQAVIETANNEKNYKFEQLKALETSMFQSTRHSAAAITHEAEKIALKIVEEARTRARTVEQSVEAIITQATADATKIRAAVDAYSEKIKRDLPNPADWEAELSKIRKQEQDRLQALIEPTVMNYLKAIDIVISNIFVDLPSKYHGNKVIQDFVEAIASIQHRKSQIKFGDLIPKLGGSNEGQAASLQALKKSS